MVTLRTAVEQPASPRYRKYCDSQSPTAACARSVQGFFTSMFFNSRVSMFWPRNKIASQKPIEYFLDKHDKMSVEESGTISLRYRMYRIFHLFHKKHSHIYRKYDIVFSPKLTYLIYAWYPKDITMYVIRKTIPVGFRACPLLLFSFRVEIVSYNGWVLLLFYAIAPNVTW